MRRMTLAIALVGCGASSSPAHEPLPSNTAEPARATPDAAPISDREAAMRAHVESEAAVRELDDARRRIEQLTRQVAIVERKISEAARRVVDAQTDSDRAATNDQLVFLQREKAELDARITVEHQRARDAERRANGTPLPAHCAHTPTAKECI